MTALAVSHLRLHLVPEQPLHLPAHNKGNSLRGGFGSAFRKLVCVDLRWECAECSLRYTCPYTKVFHPFVPPDALRLSRMRDIPRPFVFKPPRSTQTHYAAAEPVVFDLVLAGQAIDYLPYFIVAFRELGATGFGRNRARVELARVEAIAQDGSSTTVYESTTNVVRPAAPIRLAIGEGDTLSADRVSTLTLDFLTPTTLKSGSSAERQGILVRQRAFHHILKRLRDRINALATFYGDGPVDLDFKALGEAAEKVETVEDGTRWVERSRFSRRREVSHDLSGFIGRISFRGQLARFLPWLRAAEYLHVGKNAVFGNGWYRIVGGEQ